MTAKKFYVAMDVSEELLRTEPAVVDMAWRELIEKAGEEQRGPRGGRYLPVTPPYVFDDGLDFARGTRTLRLAFDARYVRPGYGR